MVKMSKASCGHPANEDGECGCSYWPEPAPDGGDDSDELFDQAADEYAAIEAGEL